MAGSSYYQKLLPLQYPHSYNAMTKLVVAMAKVSKNAGKKTFFGKDKGQESYQKFIEALRVTMQSMILDKEIVEADDIESVYKCLGELLQMFSMAHPNWQDAYAFSKIFFVEDKPSALAVMERLRV